MHNTPLELAESIKNQFDSRHPDYPALYAAAERLVAKKVLTQKEMHWIFVANKAEEDAELDRSMRAMERARQKAYTDMMNEYNKSQIKRVSIEDRHVSAKQGIPDALREALIKLIADLRFHGQQAVFAQTQSAQAINVAQGAVPGIVNAVLAALPQGPVVMPGQAGVVVVPNYAQANVGAFQTDLLAMAANPMAACAAEPDVAEGFNRKVDEEHAAIMQQQKDAIHPEQQREKDIECRTQAFHRTVHNTNARQRIVTRSKDSLTHHVFRPAVQGNATHASYLMEQTFGAMDHQSLNQYYDHLLKAALNQYMYQYHMRKVNEGNLQFARYVDSANAQGHDVSAYQQIMNTLFPKQNYSNSI